MAKASKWKEAYMKERRRIQNTMKSQEKKGFVYADDYLPKIPKVITKKSVEKLKQEYSTATVKREAIYKVDLETGEFQTSAEYRKQKAEETVKKLRAKIKTAQARRKKQVTEADLYMARINDYIEQFYWCTYAQQLKNYINRVVKSKGRWEVAKAISELWDRGIVPDDSVLYDKEKTAEYISLLGHKLDMRDEELENMIEESQWDDSDIDDYW